MKQHTAQERQQARVKLPKPVSDFLGSDALLQIYLGVIAKQRLNFNQGGRMTDIVNATLLGLEPISAIETNLHQDLPELSNAAMRELVDDLNDRVFKEANRRLQENIIEPEPEWDREEFGEKPGERGADAALPSDEDIERLAEKEKKEGWNPPEEEEEIPAPVAISTGAPAGTESSQAMPQKSVLEERLAKSLVPNTQDEQPAESAPTGIKNISKEDITVPPQAPATAQPSSAPAVPTASAAKHRYPGGVDPYREPVE